MSRPRSGTIRAPYRGYFSQRGRFARAVRLTSVEEVAAFLREHLYAEEVRITDAGDRLLFHAVDGTDLSSRLDELGIDLPGIYAAMRRAWLAEAEQEEPEEERAPREPWEALYDSIGLSSGEVGMRQRAKRACRDALTVADVIELLEGTYFDAHVETEDGSRAWGYFDAADCSARVLRRVGEDAWQEGDRRVRLDPAARVRHKGSGEDIHLFLLLDPPPEEG